MREGTIWFAHALIRLLISVVSMWYRELLSLMTGLISYLLLRCSLKLVQYIVFVWMCKVERKGGRKVFGPPCGILVLIGPASNLG